MNPALWCTHTETTDCDQDGRAICTRCGATVQQVLTKQLMVETFERVRRNFGRYGRHSMRCVETPDGWCCADDCRMEGKWLEA